MDFTTVNDDILIHRSRELQEQVTSEEGVTEDELSELLEIERELTLREGL